MADEPELGMRPEGGGIDPVDRATGGGPYRVVLVEQHLGHDRDPTLDDVRKALVAAYWTDYGAHSPTWISRFTDACRQAASYREGRVLVAGDAAHVHGPQGGQGLNVHHDLGAGHALVGRRMPDLDVTTPDGPTTVFALLHEARPLLVNFGEPADPTLPPALTTWFGPPTPT